VYKRQEYKGEKFAEGGEVMNRMEQGIASIPRQTMIRDQPHMLAYITPAEAMLLKQNGGSGLPSHGGVPEFGAIGDFFSAMKEDVGSLFSGPTERNYGDGYTPTDSRFPSGVDTGGYNTPQELRRQAVVEEENRRAANPALYKEDDKPQPVQFAQPMYQAPVNVAPPTLDPISSGQPPPPFSDLLNPTIVDPELPNNPMPVGPNMPIGQRPANKAYTFQELLGMYQNPYA
jgi:hypothetical protein